MSTQKLGFGKEYKILLDESNDLIRRNSNLKNIVDELNVNLVASKYEESLYKEIVYGIVLCF